MLSCIGMHLLTNIIAFFALQCICWQILFLFLLCNAPAQSLQVEGLLKRNKTLSEEAKAGNIYLVDYEILKGKENKFDLSYILSYILGVSTGWEGGKKDKGR